MRSIWNGSISFGLVSIPVKMYNATASASSVSFVQIHEKDGGRIRYRKVCELDGEEVPTEEIGKGYPADDSTIIPLTDDDLAALPLPTAKTLTILAFVDASEIDPLQMDKAYYLGADGPAAAKPYVLLRDALVHHEKVAIGKVAIRNRETLAMLRVHDDALVMHALLWPDQIRSAEGLAPKGQVQIRDNELTLAETLMDSLGDLDPAELHDAYREAVEELVAAKVEGAEPVAVEAGPKRGAKVIDLMAALEDSVRAARRGRGEEEGEEASVTAIGRGEGGEEEAAGGTRKKAAAKKTSPAKKTTASKKSTTAKTAKKTATKSAEKSAESGTASKRATASKKSTGSGGAKKTASSSSTAKKRTSGGGGRRAG